jgi:hypothetical protein
LTAPRPTSVSPARARTRWLRAAVVLVAAGCGGPQKLGSAGATCFRDDDCEAGYICVAPTADDIHRVCSTDPTPLISMVMGPDYGGMSMGGGAGVGGAGAPAGGAAGTASGGVPGGGSAGTASGGAGSGGGGKASTGGQGGASNGGDAGSTAAGTAAGGTAGNAGNAGNAGTAGTDMAGGAPP